jgi:isopenicillin-N N-acyltransferase-like protein
VGLPREILMNDVDGETVLPYPRIRVSGDAFHGGCVYGSESRELVHASLDLYARLFNHHRGWDWSTATAYAREFVDPIDAFNRDYLEEMAGIASGAGVELEDVLALNVRTEVIYGDPSSACRDELQASECSSFAVLASRSQAGTLLGQNWDMFVPAGRSTVILERVRTDGHLTVSVVEAGLLAKVGLNTAGLAVGTNTLVAESNRGRAGVPYHVILRALIDCSTVDEALGMLESIPFRSSSANYILADAIGRVVDVETAAGGANELFCLEAHDGLLTHTNHFLSPSFDETDVTRRISTTSVPRLARLSELTRDVTTLHPEQLLVMLADHDGGTNSICCHPDPSVEEIEHVSSLFSLVIEVESRTIWLVPGQPCETPTYLLRYASDGQIPAAG